MTSVRVHFGDRPFRFSQRSSLWVVVIISILALLPIGLLHATSYGEVQFAALVGGSDLIVVLELVPSGDKLVGKIAEVVKGVPPKDFSYSGVISAYQLEGVEKRVAGFGGDARLRMEDLALSNRRLFFLSADRQEGFRTVNPSCVLSEEFKLRVLKTLAMNEDPAPFVKSAKYVGDVDLIYVLGTQFHSLSLDAPDVPELGAYFRTQRNIPEEMPWQRMRLSLLFTFQPSREQPLQMKSPDAQGVLPDFIRKLETIDGIGKHLTKVWLKKANGQLPAEFSVTIDTQGPQRVGGLPFAGAATFLREQLGSENPEVIEQSYIALGSLMDADAVPIAIKMLRHIDPGFRCEAAKFLSQAKDPSSIEPLCQAIDELPHRITDRGAGSDRSDAKLSSALGKAVLNIHDPRMLPALKRAAFKGYAGNRMSGVLARLGDESAFDPLLSHMRNPNLNHYPDELITMVERSNFQKEPWMLEGFSSEERAAKQRQTIQWLEWWEAHKAEFRIIRTWEAAAALKGKSGF